MLDAGTTGIRVTQRASYVNGQDYFRLQWDAVNSSGSVQDRQPFHAADSYFANDDYGQGYHDPASGAVGGYVSGPWYMLFVPASPATAYEEGWYFDIWAGIGYCGDNMTCPVSGSCEPGPGFDNTLDRPGGVDNGFGLQWQRTIGSGASATVGDWWTFGSTPPCPARSRRLLLHHTHGDADTHTDAHWDGGGMQPDALRTVRAAFGCQHLAAVHGPADRGDFQCGQCHVPEGAVPGHAVPHPH